MNKQLQTLKKVYHLSFQILHKLRQGFAFLTIAYLNFLLCLPLGPNVPA
jgi:hypothetical protein